MNSSRREVSLLVLAIVLLCHRCRTSAQNSTLIVKPLKYHVPIIPIITTNILGPKKFERIIVPIAPSEKKKSVSERESEEKKVSSSSTVKPKINSKNYDDGKGNFYKSYSYVSRDDDHDRIPTDTTPNDIQPLHITTRGYKTPEPETATESVRERKTKKIEQQERLKIENLPENPYRVPETNWWDNQGKYNYGIIHDDYKGLDAIPKDVGEYEPIEDAREVESKEMVTPALAVIEPVTPVISHLHSSSAGPVRFKSSFRDPSAQPPVHQRSDIPGKFLYKTQVYYPNYRDHLYLPVTTFYGNHQGLAKVFPVFNSHTVYHNSPHHSSSPIPPVHHHPEPPVASEEVSPLPPSSSKKSGEKHPPPPPPPPAKEEQEETGEDYDYEEGEGDDEGEGGSGKYQGDSAEQHSASQEGDDYEDEEGGGEEEEHEEEEEQEQKPKYKYGSFKNSASGESGEEEDQFDLAWKKYGYGPKTLNAEEEEEDDSYESSESQIVPERKKIVHMKMEYYSTPRKDTGELVYAASNANKATVDPKTQTEAVDVERRNKRKRKRKGKSGVKSQEQHPNAGPDDLKFFQDIFIEKKSPHEIEFGHVSETPKGWEERYERQNHSKDKNRHQGKIVWADKHGGYGQHYYDLNHGG